MSAPVTGIAASGPAAVPAGGAATGVAAGMAVTETGETDSPSAAVLQAVV
jgi:hypothetical protein